MIEKLISEVKQLIIDSLRIEGMAAEEIETDVALFGEGLIGHGEKSAEETIIGVLVNHAEGVGQRWRCGAGFVAVPLGVGPLPEPAPPSLCADILHLGDGVHGKRG